MCKLILLLESFNKVVKNKKNTLEFSKMFVYSVSLFRVYI